MKTTALGTAALIDMADWRDAQIMAEAQAQLEERAIVICAALALAIIAIAIVTLIAAVLP